MAGGEEGVDRVIELLAEEIRVNMQLMGAATIADLGPELIAGVPPNSRDRTNAVRLEGCLL